MTDNTIEMAREAGFDITIDTTEMRCFVEGWEDQLKTFEALIRANERKKFFTAEEADIALSRTDFTWHDAVTQAMVDKLEAIRSGKD